MRVRTLFVLFLALAACGGCGRQKSTDELVADLKGGSDKDRVIAVRLLPQRTGDAARTVPGLIDALKDHETDVRWSAAIGLGNLGERAKDAVPALKAAQRDKDARVREAARVALSRIDPQHFAAGKPGPRS